MLKFAALSVDTRKVEFFKAGLAECGFSFTEHDGIMKGTKTLRVRYDERDLQILANLMFTLNQEKIH